MPLAYSYVRMSTDAQLKGDSLRRQVDLSRRYAKEHDLDLVDEDAFRDIGVSAFKGANVESGALGRFLRAVDEGAVPTGSYLLVESLDRISREGLLAAVPLFLQLLNKGITIVTLSDRHVYQPGSFDIAALIISITILSRAHEESRLKSQRLAAAWSNKRELAQQHKLTSRAPAWLRLSPDRVSFTLVDNRVKVVRRIFEMASSGMGDLAIARRLNKDGVPPFGRADGWHDSYVQKILQARSVLGEFQPHAKASGKRLPVGDPILDYFPAIVTEAEFIAAAAGRRARTGKGGRKGETLSNLFTHLATCAYCGSPMVMENKGSGPKGGRYLRCSSSKRSNGCTASAWRYEAFETSVLYFLRDLDISAIVEGINREQVFRALGVKQAEIRERLARLRDQRETVFQLTLARGVNVQYVSEKLSEIELDIARLEAEGNSSIQPKLDAQELSQAELLRLISVAQSKDSVEASAIRHRLASALQVTVKRLAVGPNGQQVDENVRAVLEYGPNTWSLYDPFFTATLSTGQTRLVVVRPHDPTELVQLAESGGASDLNLHVDPDGVVRDYVTGEGGGQPIAVYVDGGRRKLPIRPSRKTR